MTRQQLFIKKYLKTQFEEDTVSMIPKGQSVIEVEDKNKKKMQFSMNLYCDILDADTKQIIAFSDCPHGLDTVGISIPRSWKNNPEYFG